MRAVLFLLLAVIPASANPLYWAISVDATGVVTSYRSTSETAVTTGVQLIPWVELPPSKLPIGDPRPRYRFKNGKLTHRPAGELKALETSTPRVDTGDR